jgi:hypothetical protein
MQQIKNISADFMQIILLTSPYRLAVADCVRLIKTFKGCNGGSHHIPDNVTSPTDPLASLNVVDGVITAVPVAQDGIVTSDTVTLTPSIDNSGNVTWKASGPAYDKGYLR